MSKESPELFVGIDLGTSRSSISTSEGQRHMVESYVGWPVDMVARKILKAPVLVGREALANRSMLELHRPLERGLLKEGSDKDQQAVRQLILHLMQIAGIDEERRNGHRIRAVVGVPAEALRVNRQHLRDAMRGFVDNLIIVSEPFAVAYGLEALLHAMVIDVGAGTTDFCVMRGRYPTEEDQRTLLNAGDWIDEQLMTHLREHHEGINVSIHTVRQWKEDSSFIGSARKAVKVTVPIDGKPTELDITAEMKAACEALVPPLAETMIDLIAATEPEYQEQLRHTIILAGGSSVIPGLKEALQGALKEYGGGQVQSTGDPVFVGSDGGLELAKDAPSSDWEKLPA
jgi:rod shape-determining protein MreB